MKKRISKNIFHFSILIIELKNKKRKKKIFFFWIYFDLKPISKNENQNFLIYFSIWNQKMNFKKFFHFSILVIKLENEKWKIFKIQFIFKSEKRIILSVHGLNTSLKIEFEIDFEFEFEFKVAFKIVFSFLYKICISI